MRFKLGRRGVGSNAFRVKVRPGRMKAGCLERGDEILEFGRVCNLSTVGVVAAVSKGLRPRPISALFKDPVQQLAGLFRCVLCALAPHGVHKHPAKKRPTIERSDFQLVRISRVRATLFS